MANGSAFKGRLVLPPALSALGGAAAVAIACAWCSGPEPVPPDVALLEQTIERHERVIDQQQREMVRAWAESRAKDSVHVRDSLRLVASRDRERPIIAAARVEAHAAAVVQASAGDSLEATLDTLAVKVPDELRPVVGDAKRQHAEERSAGAAFRVAMQAQVDGQARLLIVTDSALATTEAALSAQRESAGTAAGLAELRGVVITEKDQVIDVLKAKRCGTICAVKHAAIGAGVVEGGKLVVRGIRSLLGGR